MVGKVIKRTCWVVLGFLIFCTVIFHYVFLNFLATWSLQAYSISKLGSPLEYESIFLNGNQLIIVKPRFEHEPFFMAERMALSFQFSFWKRQLYIEIEIEQPHWNFQIPLTSQWEKWVELLNQEGKWIKTHPHLRIKEGILAWVVEDLSRSYEFKFDLEINNREGGYVKLYFDSPDSANNVLVLQTLKADHGVELSCGCKTVDCSSFVALTRFLGVDFPPWLITSGVLEGELKAIFPRMHRPYLEGELMIENLAFNQVESALKGQVGQVRIHLEKNQSAYKFSDQVPATIGELEILKPASLSYQSPLHQWAIHQIQGNIRLNQVETVLIDLQAQGGNFYHPSQWNLQGKANLNAQRSFNLDFFLSCSAWGQPDGKIQVTLDQLQDGAKHARVECEKLFYGECGFLQNLLATYWPIFNDVLFEDGEFNALIEADMTQEGLGELYIKQFDASHVCSWLKPWNMTCDFEQVRGYGKVHLGKEDFWQSINAGLHLEDGNIQFENLTPPLPMTDIQAHLFIQQGHVEHSLVTLEIAGLKGKMDVEWGKHKQLLTFKLDGIVEDLADLFPSILQDGLRKHFYHNHLMVLANLKKQNQHIELGGTLHIQRANMDQMDLVHFGCELKKIQNGSEFKCVPVGWFHSQKLPLEKYLSPFIFRNGILQMSGEAEFKGSFDDQLLLIKYHADDLKIENENLSIEIPFLHSSAPGQLIGTHQIDLQTYAYQGTLPIQSAT